MRARKEHDYVTSPSCVSVSNSMLEYKFQIFSITRYRLPGWTDSNGRAFTTSKTRCRLCSGRYFTYLCLFARWEHRPSTKERHRFYLSVAIFSISLLVYPISFVSFSVSLCQVFRGLPLRLFPGGFHVMA